MAYAIQFLLKSFHLCISSYVFMYSPISTSERDIWNDVNLIFNSMYLYIYQVIFYFCPMIYFLKNN